jgi:hypothetical protein
MYATKIRDVRNLESALQELTVSEAYDPPQFDRLSRDA